MSFIGNIVKSVLGGIGGIVGGGGNTDQSAAFYKQQQDAIAAFRNQQIQNNLFQQKALGSWLSQRQQRSPTVLTSQIGAAGIRPGGGNL